MTRPILKRTSWYDGQAVTETDLDVEQTAWHDSLANNTDFQVGSGIEQEFSTQRVLFDTNNVPSATATLISTQNFDGEPIYPIDSSGNTVYLQPLDSFEGNQLEIELSGASLGGTPVTNVYLFGITFGGGFIHEVINFKQNESQITRNYFTKIVAIMTQDFRGNQNTIITGTASNNYGGRLRILESLPMTLSRDIIMVEQSVEPDMSYVDFKPATLSKTLDTLLNEIANTESLNADDLEINVTSTTTRTLFVNDAKGLIIGQKFKATTNNIQKVSILLSVSENTLAVSGEEFDWTGDIVVGIRPLQTTTSCPTDITPNSAIEFDPEFSPIAEISFDQNDLLALGITLTDELQVVDFVFTQSLLANPNLAPTIDIGAYYMLTIRRSGNTSVGNIVLQEAANTNADPNETDPMYMSVFSNNVWTDIINSDLWFKIYTNAIRITDGTAFDSGVQVTSPRTKTNTTTGLDESYIEGRHSLLDVSQTTKNYVILQRSTNFTDSVSHPSTGNPVFSRIEDAPSIAVVLQSTLTTLIDASSEPIVIGSVRDTNPVGNPQISGIIEFPGLVRSNTFTIIQPASDLQLNNLVGSILVPNTAEPELKYRIIDVEFNTDAYGDVNNDGTIDSDDVSRAQVLDGYSKDLVSGSLASVAQRNAIVDGTVTMEEIIRADVTDDGIIDITDPQMIQQNIALGTAFIAGSNFNRAVLTIESLTNPLTTTPNMITADSAFNAVPFTNLTYRIDFVSLWVPHNLELVDLRRFVPKTFTKFSSSDITASTPSGGKNISFIPGDLLFGGELLNLDETQYKIDFEVNTIVVDLSDGSTQGEINIFSNFIKNKMYFYDGTLVASGALENNQIRVTASIQSFVKDSDGYDFESLDGYTKIETTVALLYVQSSGLLRIRADNIRNSITRPELRTKIILTVYLKKAGFRNTETSVTSSELEELLTLL
ncbi:hypothetical protein LCGC14_0636420 [marine sediment metagenome]|uniref:Dockerin domain-containing protein n=1 Tax=marine sediment metagenome TaxID=412755 RepID=A0A0F9RJQ2_9ZZZZ